MNEIYSASPYSGKTFRLALQNCDNDYFQSSDLDNIKYTVYHVDMGVREAVTGHTSVTIPTSAMADTPLMSHNAETYNFEYRISAASVVPFAIPGDLYLVVFTFIFSAEPYDFCVWIRPE